MATYNGARFLPAQLESILPQLGAGDELVISDDGSQDKTTEIIAHFNDRRIKLVRNPAERGVVRNFENALKAARGDFIFLADQDDIWSEKKVRTMTEVLRTHTLVTCDCAWINEEGKAILDSFFRFRSAGNGVLRNLARNGFVGCCMAFRRELLQRCIPFPSGIAMHDWWIGLMAEMKNEAYFLNDVLVHHRRHHGSSTIGGRVSYLKFIDRANMCFHLLLRGKKRESRHGRSDATA